MNEAFERLYHWYLLGCRWEEQKPMSRDEFAAQHLLKELNGGLLASEIFDRTTAEWELAREDALWTRILQSLRRMNLTTETSELVRAIQTGRNSEDESDTGSAGVPAYTSPHSPVLVGAGAKRHPDLDPDPLWRLWCSP